MRSGQPPGLPQTVGQITIDIDVTGHVSPRQAEFTWAPEQSTQSAPLTYYQHRAIGGPGLTSVPGADPHWQVDADGCSKKVRQAISDGRHDLRSCPDQGP